MRPGQGSQIDLSSEGVLLLEARSPQFQGCWTPAQHPAMDGMDHLLQIQAIASGGGANLRQSCLVPISTMQA